MNSLARTRCTHTHSEGLSMKQCTALNIHLQLSPIKHGAILSKVFMCRFIDWGRIAQPVLPVLGADVSCASGL